MALWSKPSREEPVVPMHCPWCGGAMKRGYLTSGAGWLRLDNEGGSVNTYKTAWRCESCEKLVLDTTGMRRMGEDRYVGPFTETKEEEPNETREEDSNHNGTALL